MTSERLGNTDLPSVDSVWKRTSWKTDLDNVVEECDSRHDNRRYKILT